MLGHDWLDVYFMNVGVCRILTWEWGELAFLEALLKVCLHDKEGATVGSRLWEPSHDQERKEMREAWVAFFLNKEGATVILIWRELSREKSRK